MAGFNIAALEKLRLRGRIVTAYKLIDGWFIPAQYREKYGWSEVVAADFVNTVEDLYGCHFIKIELSYCSEDILAEMKSLTGEA